MSLGNRPYWRGDQQNSRGGGYGGGVSIAFPKPGPGVGGLLIANIVMFILQQITPILVFYLAVRPLFWWQIWRYVTFQFLHNDFLHILFNMLMLYFLGIHLERAWGTRRFLVFYLTCGVIAGLTFLALAPVQNDTNTFLLGASGGVMAVVAACAILFPRIQLILVIFPVPIRVAAIIFFAISALFILSGKDSTIAHAAHFGGLAAGALWVWLGPRLRQARQDARQKINNGAWERRMRREQQDRAEVDRILDKIQREGIQSLSSREKRILQDATEKQRHQDRTINRM